jgi:glucosamine-6-phosphate deaminase
VNDAAPLTPRDALRVPKEALGRGAPIALAIVPDNDTLIRRFADMMVDEFRDAKARGRDKVLFIVPVGPVGQFELVAERCNAERIDLRDLVVINMDEYLAADGAAFIPIDDPLSFRRHMRDRFYARLDPALAPPVAQRVFPDPADPGAVPRLIARWGGVDACFGGIGITGHVAFNDPPQPGETMSLEDFAALPTRVVKLSRETILINAVTTSRGNIDRIPPLAVTVGMKEILESRKVRIFMNRDWQSAIVRKILHGPVTPAVPASLLQRHPDVSFTIVEHVAALPEPQLR